MLASAGIDYSNPQWCVSKSINGLPDNWVRDAVQIDDLGCLLRPRALLTGSAACDPC